MNHRLRSELRLVNAVFDRYRTNFSVVHDVTIIQVAIPGTGVRAVPLRTSWDYTSGESGLNHRITLLT